MKYQYPIRVLKEELKKIGKPRKNLKEAKEHRELREAIGELKNLAEMYTEYHRTIEYEP